MVWCGGIFFGVFVKCDQLEKNRQGASTLLKSGLLVVYFQAEGFGVRREVEKYAKNVFYKLCPKTFYIFRIF